MPRLARRNERLLVLLAGGLLVTLALGLALHAEAAPRQYKAPGIDQTRLILRLPDLPLGFRNFSFEEGDENGDPFCSRLTHPAHTPPKLVRFMDEFHPSGCITTYSASFAPPGEPPPPPFVGSGVMALGSGKAARRGWAVVPILLGRWFGGPPHMVATTTKIGDATRRFHLGKLHYPFRLWGDAGSFLAWRSAKTLAVVMTIGDSFAQTDAFAAELAQRQQAHILKPTPYTNAERFDGEVGLENPAIDIPVYWLGRNFKPGGGLPPNRLYESGFSGKAFPETNEGLLKEAPGAPLWVSYANIWLHTWTPATWDVFANSRTGHIVTTWKCTKTRAVPLAEGSATIFGGYNRNFTRCPNRPPDVFTAWVDIGGVKVVVNSPPAPNFIETVNPYGSFKRMEAIVRALHLRP
jgi:hypothetical protein